MRRDVLALALAHCIQSKTLGDLSKHANRTLDAVAAKEFGEASARETNQPKRLRPGTKLVREWHGITHDVAVVEDGFIWNSERFGSLSAIARAITGTRWNGLVFFGLKVTGQPTSRPSMEAAKVVDG